MTDQQDTDEQAEDWTDQAAQIRDLRYLVQSYRAKVARLEYLTRGYQLMIASILVADGPDLDRKVAELREGVRLDLLELAKRSEDPPAELLEAVGILAASHGGLGSDLGS